MIKDNITENKDNLISLQNIKSLSGLDFFIPDYQRGYRWTKTQAIQMLHDFLEFIYNGKSKFYCLQPIVVKPRSWTDFQGNEVRGYEVIDGQQRLTTIYLLLTALFCKDPRNKMEDFELFSISYQTRTDSREFLEKITDSAYRESKAYECMDFYHINLVFNTFTSELKGLSDDRILRDMILGEDFRNEISEEDDDEEDSQIHGYKTRNARVIWYEIGTNEKATSEDIFTRLNIGKIPLTNAELIKAVFLKDSNFGKITASTQKEQKAQELGISLQQNKIAAEWNYMEAMLQRDDFWYFLGASSQGKDYDTRIEFIFDLMSKWNKDCEPYHTFNIFQEKIKSAGKKRAAENVWKEVKDYFRELEYWFNDRKLFHLIGFLIDCGVTIKEIKDLSEKKDKDNQMVVRLRKDEFLEAIEVKVKEVMSDVDLSKLRYSNKKEAYKINKTLLLFTILSVIENSRSDVKFPFDKYKKESWDREHIASQTDRNKSDVPIKNSARQEWIHDMLYYFTGISENDAINDKGAPEKDPNLKDQYLISSVEGYLAAERQAYESITDEEKRAKRDKELDIISRLLNARKMSVISFEKKHPEGFSERYDLLLRDLFKDTRKYFEEDRLDEEEKDGIGNMALLNSSINRSYGNAFFALKRMHIRHYDSEGVFIPLSTKNVFMKYYSPRVDNMLTWTHDDAVAYAKAIEDKLSKFISSKNDGQQK